MAREPSENRQLERCCEGCGKVLAPGEGRLVRVRRNKLELLCQDCEGMLLPPDNLMEPVESDERVKPVNESFTAADPRAATVELPPPPTRKAIEGPPSSAMLEVGATSISKELPAPATARTWRLTGARLATYVALAAIAGALAGLLWVELFVR